MPAQAATHSCKYWQKVQAATLIFSVLGFVTWAEAKVTVTGKDVSKGYNLPSSKQGIQDQRYYNNMQLSPADRTGRYQRLRLDVAPAVHQYNAYWSSFEKAGVVPSDTPTLACPKGSVMVPATPGLKAALGFTHYHCYDNGTLNDFGDLLARDAAHGMESAAVIWSAPPWARYGNCSGATFNGKLNFGGCVPREDAMADFSDFIIFLSTYYNGTGSYNESSPGSNTAYGRFTHYILWNENACGDWFDYSPFVSTSVLPDAAHKDLWVTKYAEMLRAANGALARNHDAAKPQMLYVSIDRIWQQPATCPSAGFQHCHMGTKNFLDGLWAKVGIEFDWSVAVHPYGDPTVTQWPSMYTFADLPQIVAYQKGQLRTRNVTNVNTAPQSMLAATEQGWDGYGPQEPVAAKYICACQSIMAASDNMVYSAHYDFQGVLAGDTRGLVQRDLGSTLSNASALPSLTYAAYKASHPAIWGSNPGHYCCVVHNLGCPSF